MNPSLTATLDKKLQDELQFAAMMLRIAHNVIYRATPGRQPQEADLMFRFSHGTKMFIREISTAPYMDINELLTEDPREVASLIRRRMSEGRNLITQSGVGDSQLIRETRFEKIG